MNVVLEFFRRNPPLDFRQVSYTKFLEESKHISADGAISRSSISRSTFDRARARMEQEEGNAQAR